MSTASKARSKSRPASRSKPKPPAVYAVFEVAPGEAPELNSVHLTRRAAERDAAEMLVIEKEESETRFVVYRCQLVLERGAL